MQCGGGDALAARTFITRGVWVASKHDRQREYERRRYEEWQARQAKNQAKRRRRNQWIAGGVVGALVAVIVVVAVVTSGDDDTPAAADPSATATASAQAPEPTPLPARTPSFSEVPDPSTAQARTWTGDLTLNSGVVPIELDGKAAPQAVANFVALAQDGYFDGTKCHRLVTSGIYVLQCGDPTATGMGGPGYEWGPIENAPADNLYPAGTIAMARVGNDANSMGSQFFLVYQDSNIPSDSAGGYTVFGHMSSAGVDVVKAIADAGTVDGTPDAAPKSDVIIEGVKIQ